MRKALVSILLIFSLFLSSCATSVKVQGIELNNEVIELYSEKADFDKDEIIAYTTIVAVCGTLYIVIPVITMEYLKKN